MTRWSERLNSDEALSLIEAADVLGTSPDNLRAAIKRGSLVAEKHGRDWWVDPQEVERYRLEHRRKPCR